MGEILVTLQIIINETFVIIYRKLFREIKNIYLI
jgi:hypothetical protein